MSLFGKKKRRGRASANGGGLFHALRAHFTSAESAAKDNDWWKADYLSADADASPDTLHNRTIKFQSPGA